MLKKSARQGDSVEIGVDADTVGNGMDHLSGALSSIKGELE